MGVLAAPLLSAHGPNCKQWNTDEYFNTATVEDVTACLEAGAELMARNKLGNTPLHDAAGNNKNPAVIEALLKAGADPMARDEKGGTPLHVLADRRSWTSGGRGAVAVIEVLLAAGADPMAKNSEGGTPWDLVKRNRELKGSDAYWRLNDARYEPLGGGARRVPTAIPEPAGNEDVPASGTGCQVQGYPSPAGGVVNLGFSWCPASVDLQVRAFALQAAGAQCAIATGNSSTNVTFGILMSFRRMKA